MDEWRRWDSTLSQNPSDIFSQCLTFLSKSSVLYFNIFYEYQEIKIEFQNPDS